MDLRLDDEIDSETFAEKATELRDKSACLRLHLESADRGRNEIIDIAVKAFELSQSLREKWLTVDYAAKRRILEITCLNFSLDDVTLVPTMRKPFDILVEGLVWKNSRGDKTAIELFRRGVTAMSAQIPMAAQGLVSLLSHSGSDEPFAE